MAEMKVSPSYLRHLSEQAPNEVDRKHFAALADEVEQLRWTVDALLHAIENKGSHPEYHDEVRRRHEREWPVLWRAIAALREARRG